MFNENQERKLVEHILKLEKQFFGLSTFEVRKLEFEYALRNNIANKFNNKMKVAGKYLLLERLDLIKFR